MLNDRKYVVRIEGIACRRKGTWALSWTVQKVPIEYLAGVILLSYLFWQIPIASLLLKMLNTS